MKEDQNDDENRALAAALTEKADEIDRRKA